MNLVVMECRYCNQTFTKKSNLKRHMLRKHDSKSIHYHGLQFVDKRFVAKETICYLHQGIIENGKMFHCFPCNFSICTDCMEEDCRYCKRDICTHKNILIIINYKSCLLCNRYHLKINNPDLNISQSAECPITTGFFEIVVCWEIE